MLQFLNTEGNRPRTEAFMGFENGNPFFGEDHPRCQSGVESVGNCVFVKIGLKLKVLLIEMGTGGKW